MMSAGTGRDGGAVAVVTGAGRGIGLEVARQLAARGMTVVACARDVDAARAAVADVPGTFEFARLDVTSDVDADALGELLGSFQQGVAALVNNAGVVLDGWGASVFETPLDTLRSTWEINTLGVLRVTQAVVPHLQRSDERARIVNVSSGMGQLAQMGSGHVGYRTSKTALNALTRVFAAELGDTALVASVCPGWVRTDMGGESATRDVSEGADTIVWLASGEADDTAGTGHFWRDRKVIAW